ncbi:FAD/NAD(P)-binding domain-containing protein [Patellaria atrata CBS 101060]|uniref:FAD/NAD(P)-binding domain-containing protein n=1 Tax=Patellaria atrata CBS 101060 TaxID=1346257 RepID=A0A9P4SHJ9_9PEZI|nr:FAD/NAD(P)-binding domain-containing protein [Patellaria atrata CBS 101060]
MATATTEHELSVIIAGAGSTGLLVAQVLKKVGIACTVYEADPTPTHRPRDWNFGIYWAQSPLGNCLPQELNDQLTACQVDIHTPAADDILPVLNGKTGEVLKEVAAPFNLRLQRRKFIQLLGTGIDIQYGKRLVGVESGNGIAKAKFEDGSEHTANLLIGAEGAHSVVRNFLCGPEKGALKESPLVANATICRLPAENALAIRKLHHRSTIWFHPNNSFTWFGVHNAYERDNPEDWEFMFLQSWKEEDSTPLSQTKILQDMKTRADDFADPYKSCVYAIAEGTKCWRSRLKYWPTEPWDNLNGTVTLAGDAAHPMTFRKSLHFHLASL